MSETRPGSARATRPGGGPLPLSDALSRSGESDSPKRVLEEEPGVLCSHPRPGEGFYFWAKDDLAQASCSRPSEMLVECYYSRSRLSEKA